MAENKNSFEDILTKLALIVDGTQAIFPKSKSVMIYELNQKDFNYVRSNFRNLKFDDNQIKIDISGTEIVFILENSYQEEPIVIDKKEEKEENKSFLNKLKNLFTSKKSS